MVFRYQHSRRIKAPVLINLKWDKRIQVVTLLLDLRLREDGFINIVDHLMEICKTPTTVFCSLMTESVSSDSESFFVIVLIVVSACTKNTGLRVDYYVTQSPRSHTCPKWCPFFYPNTLGDSM